MSDVFQTDQNEPQPLDTDKNYYEDLVGEGKKFKDNEALARAKTESDRYVAHLLKRLDETEAALTKRNNEEEFLTRMEQLTKTRTEPMEPTIETRPVEKSALTPEQVEQMLNEREAKKQAEQNINDVTNKLSQVFGSDYRTRVQTQAKALGVGTDFLTDVASKNPQAFYRLMGMEDQPTRQPDFAPPPRSTAPFQPNTGNKKNYAYYKAQREQKGEGWYFSKAVQREIWNSVSSMGEAEFYKE